jgi:hypothetical protein
MERRTYAPNDKDDKDKQAIFGWKVIEPTDIKTDKSRHQSATQD